jgi:hypothetical protein
MHARRPWPERLFRRVKAFRLRWEHLHHVSLATVALIAVAVFFVLGVVLRLAMGPVSLGPFSDRLRTSVLNALPGLAVRYDDAAVEWSRDEGRVNLIIVGARIFDNQHHIIAQAPKAEIGLAAGAFVRGQIEIRRIALVGVQLTLVRTKEGALRLGVERSQTSEDVLQRIRDAIQKSGNGASTLERFAVSKARLAFYDEGTGLFVVAPDANVDVANEKQKSGPPQLFANVDAAVEVTGQPAHLVAKIRLPQVGGDLSGDIAVTGLELAALAKNAKTFAFLNPFDLRTDLSASFTVERGTHLRTADLGVSATGIVGSFGSPLTVKNLRFVGRYDGNTGRLLIDDAELQGETATAHAQGMANLAFASDGALVRANLDLTADKITFAMPSAFKQAVTFGGVAVRGSYITANRTFTVDRLTFGGPAVSGVFSGRVVIAQNQSPEIDLQGKLDPLSVRDLVRYWPLRVGEGARAWLAEKMPAGGIGPMAIDANIKAGALDRPALPEDALKIAIPVQDASVEYLRGMTLLTHANGNGLLTGDTFRVQLTSGRVGPIAVRKGMVVIPQLHQHGTVGDIAFTVQGQMRDLLTILDEKPLQYPSKFHIKPAETAGAATVDADFHVPMVKGVGVDRIPIKVKAVANGLALSLGPETRLSNGNVTFDIDNSRLHAVGSVDYGRIPLAADWTELFESKNGITTNVTVRGTLDEAARNALKLHFSDVFSGPVGVTAQLSGSRGIIKSAQAAIDLTPATLSWNPISYKKAPGSPATANVTARLDAKGTIETAEVSLSGSGLAAQGTLNFTPEGAVARAEFPTFHAGPQNDFALSLSQTSAKGFDVFIRGHSADGSAFGRRGTSANGNAPESNTPYHFVARLDRMTLAEGTVLAPFNLDANTAGSRIQTLSLSTGMSKGDSVSANISPIAGGRKVTVDATDAGLLLKGVFGLDDISGGRLTLTAKMPPMEAAAGPASYAGVLTIRDFRIENQPFFSRLFSAGSLGGLLDLMRGSGIVIDKLEMPFTAKGDVIDIQDGHASGPSVGLSGDGYIDRRANRIDLRGAVAPIYGLNSMLGAIPLVGDVLVSKKGEGILGVTYEASGNLDEPKISVNPLSVLTPGIFRRIFEGKAPSAPEQANKTVPAPGQAPH